MWSAGLSFLWIQYLGFLEFTSPAGRAVTSCSFHEGRNEAQGTHQLPRAAAGAGKFSSTDTWCWRGCGKAVRKQLPAPAARSSALPSRQSSAPLQREREWLCWEAKSCSWLCSYGQQELPQHPTALSLPHAWRMLRVWLSHKLTSAGSLGNVLDTDWISHKIRHQSSQQLLHIAASEQLCKARWKVSMSLSTEQLFAPLLSVSLLFEISQTTCWPKINEKHWTKVTQGQHWALESQVRSRGWDRGEKQGKQHLFLHVLYCGM